MHMPSPRTNGLKPSVGCLDSKILLVLVCNYPVLISNSHRKLCVNFMFITQQYILILFLPSGRWFILMSSLPPCRLGIISISLTPMISDFFCDARCLIDALILSEAECNLFYTACTHLSMIFQTGGVGQQVAKDLYLPLSFYIAWNLWVIHYTCRALQMGFREVVNSWVVCPYCPICSIICVRN